MPSGEDRPHAATTELPQERDAPHRRVGLTVDLDPRQIPKERIRACRGVLVPRPRELGRG